MYKLCNYFNFIGLVLDLNIKTKIIYTTNPSVVYCKINLIISHEVLD